MTYSRSVEPAGISSPNRPTRAVAPGQNLLAAHGLKVDLYSDFAGAEQVWRAFERHACASCYQRFEFLSAWQRHVGAAEGVQPLVVVGRRRDGGVAFIWPMGLRRTGPVVAASWLGGKHSNFNIGLYDAAFASEFGPAALRAVMARIKHGRPELDLFELSNQPESWMGMPNPMARLPRRRAPSPAFSTALADDFEALWLARRGAKNRKRTRWQLKKLGELGEVRFYRAATAGEADRVLDAFFAQRRARMEWAGLANPFDEPGAQAMLRELACRPEKAANSALELFALEVGGHVVATYGGARFSGRFSAHFNSFDMDERFSRHSPGELLLQHVIEWCVAEKVKAFDLGVGDADYKRSWCDTEEALFDTLLPVSAPGRAYCLVRAAALSAKRLIKSNALAWRLAQLARRIMHRVRQD